MDPTASTNVLGTLGINGGLLIAQLINFVIVLLVMWKWVYTPLVAMMDKRTKEIQDGIDNAKRAEDAFSSASAEKERIIQAARAEAHAFLETAKGQAETLRKEKLAETKTEIEKIAMEAKDRLKAEREATFDALKGDIGKLVAMATQKVASNMDEKGQHELIERAVKDLERA
ncbi:MAG: F0F1 ATP synthase subunit B [Patescibacteria group bacterium]